MMRVTETHPWLDVDLGRTCTVLSWAINRPGFARARHVSWREVRDDDLGPELDVPAWLAGELDRTGRSAHVTMLTSRAVSERTRGTAHVGSARSECLATVGLSNAESVVAPATSRPMGWGTINCLVTIEPGLTRAALIEALSIVAEARTAAVIAAGPDGATGTGTDCIAVAADEGPAAYAGLHTDVGRAVAAATYRAVLSGVEHWMATEAKGVAHEA